jgi:hypothetical protein
MEFICRISKDHGLDFGERNRAIFKAYMRDNPGMVLKITPVLPESNKQRGFLEGAVIPLVTFYQEGMDHRNGDDVRRVREWLKLEFNGEMLNIGRRIGSGGQMHLIAKSTKGRDALQPFLERVLEWLQENYAPPSEALDPEKYKVWRETIFPSGGPADYISYLQEVGMLRRGV